MLCQEKPLPLVPESFSVEERVVLPLGVCVPRVTGNEASAGCGLSKRKEESETTPRSPPLEEDFMTCENIYFTRRKWKNKGPAEAVEQSPLLPPLPPNQKKPWTGAISSDSCSTCNTSLPKI